MAQSLIASMVCVGSPSTANDDRSDVQSLHWASALGSDGHSSPSTSPRSPSRHLLYASDLSAPPTLQHPPAALEWHRGGLPAGSPASYTRELMSRGGGGGGCGSVVGGGSAGTPVFRRGSGNMR